VTLVRSNSEEVERLVPVLVGERVLLCVRDREWSIGTEAILIKVGLVLLLMLR
jgi:hypothetical protein